MAGSSIPAFGRGFFSSDQIASRIGTGALGGKAEGLIRVREVLSRSFAERPVRDVEVSIPRMSVLATDAFDRFMDAGRLYDIALSGASDERIAHAFQKADLPIDVVGDLRAVVEEARQPLAVRSSGLLEDALAHPFAGVYETKMVPNNQPDAAGRFTGLVEAVKLVYASAFFEAARSYRRAIGADDRAEKMAVVIQEIVGGRHGDRFYPHVSGVGRSFNYYPTGSARPEDGVVQLALGLGKTIVDGGVCWTYSARFPAAPPPFASPRAMVDETQTRFWAVNMGKAPAYDPLAETEHMVLAPLADAEYDGTLRYLASTYVSESDRLSPGIGRDGPRVVDFAPLLQLGIWRLNDVVTELVRVAEESLGTAAEIEFAATVPATEDGVLRVGLVQVRAMATPDEEIAVEEVDLTGADVLLSSRRVMGNGESRVVRDVVYVKPGAFEFRHSRTVAGEIAALNHTLLDQGRPYMLVGYGRWGSSDPWLGIPVAWGHVSGARIIVEATLPGVRIEPSQGAHFFHNVSSLGIVYFSVGPAEPTDIRWPWIEERTAVTETDFLRHVTFDAPLRVRVDGRRGRGYVSVETAPRSEESP